MNEKLRLDPDSLCVSSFEAQAAPTERGTVNANDAFASTNPSCRTQCFTTPCCPPTVLC